MIAQLVVWSVLAVDPLALSFTWPVRPLADYRRDQEMFDLFDGHGYHLGEDWNRKYDPGQGEDGNIDLGDPVYCIGNGRVVRAHDIETMDAWGKVVVVAHTLPDYQIIYSVYAHLERIDVEVGDYLTIGQPLGTIGDANGYYSPEQNGSSAHLHFVLMKRGPFPPEVSGYLPTLTLKMAKQYRLPSLFIRHRELGREEIINLRSGGWRPVVPWRPAPAYTAYLTAGGQVYSLGEAIEEGRLRLRYMDYWGNMIEIESRAELNYLYFSADFLVEAQPTSRSATLTLFPLNYDRLTAAWQAKQDMILAADFLDEIAEITVRSFRTETFTIVRRTFTENGVRYRGYLSDMTAELGRRQPSEFSHWINSDNNLDRLLTLEWGEGLVQVWLSVNLLD